MGSVLIGPTIGSSGTMPNTWSECCGGGIREGAGAWVVFWMIGTRTWLAARGLAECTRWSHVAQRSALSFWQCEVAGACELEDTI